MELFPFLLTIYLLTFVFPSKTISYPFTILPQPTETQPPLFYHPPHSQNPNQENPVSISPSSDQTPLAPILTSLGFQELAMAIPSLSSTSSSLIFTGPTTVFAPSDDSIRTCPSCSLPRLLSEHIVPGNFSLSYLQNLSFGTKLETLNPNHCITITSSSPTVDNSTKIFINGVEIIRPDVFDDGHVIIHGLQGFIGPLSSSSCKTPLQNPILASPPHAYVSNDPSLSSSSAIMRLMLRDAMVKLHDTGYSVLSLAMKVKSSELLSLQNMTVFVLDDASIFAGGHAYVSNVRFHIVPNRFLMHEDLIKLPVGTTFPTLVHGQSLVVTNPGPSLRINYVPLKVPDAMFNLKIVVHTIFLPFPHLSPTQFSSSSAMDGEVFQIPSKKYVEMGKMCASPEDCAMRPTVVGQMVKDDGL
ncbi:putative fasciclin-like arabinogalactan protein 20 [Tasmannia lanceolata]|uniref:putative fasciclin-like arabinogalactan protein 20 n=1 Tax=Tasmannia lanceolata TaxID=3420 RepID=UPI004062BA62